MPRSAPARAAALLALAALLAGGLSACNVSGDSNPPNIATNPPLPNTSP